MSTWAASDTGRRLYFAAASADVIASSERPERLARDRVQGGLVFHDVDRAMAIKSDPPAGRVAAGEEVSSS